MIVRVASLKWGLFFPMLWIPIYVCLGLLSFSAYSGEPYIANSFVSLQKDPSFDGAPLKLPSIWGPSLRYGGRFRVEKSYGRWIYGQPAPLPKMKKKDHAQKGWIFNRFLLPDYATPVLTDFEREEILKAQFYGRQAWKSLNLNLEKSAIPSIEFLEKLVLSIENLQRFRTYQETSSIFWPNFIAAAHAAETNELKKATGSKDSLAVSGANIDFLRESAKSAADKRKAEYLEKLKLELKPPKIPSLDQITRDRILGRYIAQREFEFPQLSYEEVDGFQYMQALLKVVLSGCSQDYKEYWQDKYWTAMRFKSVAAMPQKTSWYNIELPGYLFLYSSRSFSVAMNEAELAYVLLRPLVDSAFQKKNLSTSFDSKRWPNQLVSLASPTYANAQMKQSIKDNSNLDVATAIHVDLETSRCLAAAGYDPRASLNYLKRLARYRNKTWAQYFAKHSIGLNYRINQLETRLKQQIAGATIMDNKKLNPSRFNVALRIWNITLEK